jgi:bifunctional DNase/RNase
MKKIALEIVGLQYSQTQSGAYVLVLGEMGGTRRLPIIIGSSEAQAIAIGLENMVPLRPVTHDLFKTFAQEFGVKMTQILIHELREAVFHATLFCADETGREVAIDARTSDAVALAVRFGCPIFIYEKILEDSGIRINEEDAITTDPETDPEYERVDDTLAELSDDVLQKRLQYLLDNEEYEEASRVRDELHRRKGLA